MRSGKLAALGRTVVHGYHDVMSEEDAAGKPGTTWFVSRHPGAVEWAGALGICIDRWAGHIDPAQVACGDTVIGTLPVNLAAEVCWRGACYWHLSLRVPVEWRGRELSAVDLQVLEARVEPFGIVRLHHTFPRRIA